MIEKVTIESRYVVSDKGTSDGTQIKYFKKGFWYKEDRYGGEGEAEELASLILSLSGYEKNKFVHYSQAEINENPGCRSKNFLGKDEQFITLYRLHMNIIGKDPASVTARMDYDDAIDYMLGFVDSYTDIDIREYLADTFVLDEIIQNTDRHFNNLGLVYDGESFRPAPIFDNGKSLGVGLGTSEKAYAKAFSGSFRLNREYLQKSATLKPSSDTILRHLDIKHDEISKRARSILIKTLSEFK